MQQAVNGRTPIDPADARRATIVGVAAIGACWLLALLIGINARSCSAIVPMPALCRPTTAMWLAIAISALPLLAYVAGRRILVAAFGLYIILVPIDSALLVGSSLTVTKIAGIAAAAAALWTLIKRRNGVTIPYAVFGWLGVLALMALSIVWTLDQTAAKELLLTISFDFALFALIALVPFERRDFDGMVAATVVSGVVAGIIAIAMAGHDIPTIGGGAGRLYLTFGSATVDPNGFAAALLLPIAVTFGAATAQRGWRRLALFGVLLFPLSAIYLLASRGSSLALIAMALVGILASRHRLKLAAILAAVVGACIAIPNTIVHRFLLESGQVNGAERLDIWGVAVQSFRSHWLIGSGLASFPSAYDRAFFSAFQPQFTMWHRAPHSLLISTATELGIVGLVVMATALILQYRSLIRLRVAAPYSWVPVAYKAAFVGLLVAASFVDVLRTKHSWLLFTEMLVAARFAWSWPKEDR